MYPSDRYFSSGASFSPRRISFRIIVSVLRDDHTAGVAKTVPQVPWILDWREGQLPGGAGERPYEEKAKGKRESEGEGKSDGPRLKPSLLVAVFPLD